MVNSLAQGHMTKEMVQQGFKPILAWFLAAWMVSAFSKVFAGSLSPWGGLAFTLAEPQPSR